jgi:hypothetical protein
MRKKKYSNVPNKNAQVGVCLGFVEWRFESAEFVNETAQGADVRFGVVRRILHPVRLHVVWSPSKIDER